MISAEADLTSGRIIVSSTWADKDRIKSIPGSKWDTAQKFWTVPLSWAACCALRGEFLQDLRIGEALAQWARDEKLVRITPANELRGQMTPIPGDDLDVIESWKGTGPLELFPHQQAGAQFLVTAQDAVLTDEMGTGKTATSLASIRLLDETDCDPYPVLIVCPNTVKRNWQREIDLWLPGATAYPLVGTLLQRRRALASAASDPQAVVIVNIEGVRSLSRLAPYGSIRLVKCIQCDKREGEDIPVSRCEVHLKELNLFGFHTCILDEAHRIKDPKAKQTRAVWATFHGATVQNRWGLTGTLIANHPGDLWSLMHAIAANDFQTRSKFIERYAKISFNAYGMEIHGLNAENKEEFFKFMNPRMRRVLKEIVLPNLPSKVYVTREVELSSKQRKLYDQLVAGAAAELDSGDILVAPMTLTLQTRLLQLSSATCDIEYKEDGDPADPASWIVTLKDPSSKIDELMEIIGEIGNKPIAVAAEHRKLLELVATRLDKAGIAHRSVTGAVDERQRDLNMTDFNAGVAQVLLFTYKAGGVGLNMTKADTLIRLQRSWSLIDHKQGEDRVHRIGSDQHESITIIDIVAADTVELDQLESLQVKIDRLEEINRDRAQLEKHGLDTSHLDIEEAELIS